MAAVGTWGGNNYHSSECGQGAGELKSPRTRHLVAELPVLETSLGSRAKQVAQTPPGCAAFRNLASRNPRFVSLKAAIYTHCPKLTSEIMNEHEVPKGLASTQ